MLGKLTATIVALVLVFQSGCDLLCRHAEEIASMQESAVPPCHDTGDDQKSDHQDRHDNHGTSQECLHPEAADDSSKFQTKIVKASQPVALVSLPSIPVRLQSRVPLVAINLGWGISPSSAPTSVLRI